MERYLIAHDLGTSASKASMFRVDGTLVASSEVSYSTAITQNGHGAEQDPEDWWRAFCLNNAALMEHVGSGAVEAVAVSGQMMECLPLDATGKALHPCMIWADNRAEDEADELKRKLGTADYYAITGNCPSANYSAEKMMWLRKHKPVLYEKTAAFVQPKDYITHRLTGSFVTDETDAGHMHLYDIFRRCWSEKMIRAAGLDQSKLPRVISAGTPLARLDKDAAASCGLPEGVLLVQGAGDGRVAMLGSGVYDSGDAYISLGTSSWFCQTGTKEGIDPEYGLYKGLSLRKGYYANGGTMSAGGLSYRWFRDTLCKAELEQWKLEGLSPFRALDDALAKVPAGAHGVMFLPYLHGERAPYFDPMTKAAFLGLTDDNTKLDMGKSVLEGVAMHLKLIMDRVAKLDEISSLRIVGGGAKSDLWRQIIADVFQMPVGKTTLDLEAGNLGTAVLAGYGAGIYEDFSVVKQFNRVESLSIPDRKRGEIYARMMPAFADAYTALDKTNRLLDMLKHIE